MPKTSKKTQQFSVTFSKATADFINEMLKQPEYRNNRSLAIETFITSSPQFELYLKSKKTKKKAKKDLTAFY